MRYPINVILWRGSSNVPIKDKARRINGEIYELKKEKQEIPAPASNEYISYINGKQPTIFLQSPVKGVYIYLRIPNIKYNSVNNEVTADYEVRSGLVTLKNEPESKHYLKNNKISLTDNEEKKEIKRTEVVMELLDHDVKNWLIDSYKRIEERNKREQSGFNAFMTKYGALIGLVILTVALSVAFTQYLLPLLRMQASAGINVVCHFPEANATVMSMI